MVGRGRGNVELAICSIPLPSAKDPRVESSHGPVLHGHGKQLFHLGFVELPHLTETDLKQLLTTNRRRSPGIIGEIRIMIHVS